MLGPSVWFVTLFSRAPSVVRELWLFRRLELWLLCFGKLKADRRAQL